MAEESNIKALVVDDHAVIRAGIGKMLEQTGNIRMVGQAATASEARRMLEKDKYDIVFMDIEMPGRNGLEALKVFRQAWPKLPIIIMSMHGEEQYGMRALKAGASGYLNKMATAEKVMQAATSALAGRKYISPEMTQIMADRLENGERGDVSHECLSDREFQTFQFIAAGKKLSDIAEKMQLSPKTVSVYRARVMEKMQMKTNNEIVRYALQHNLVA